jgi:hypothetical protein
MSVYRVSSIVNDGSEVRFRCKNINLDTKIEVGIMVINDARVVPSPTEMTNSKYRVVPAAQNGLYFAERLQDYRQR